MLLFVQDDLAEHSVASPPRIDIDTGYESYDPFDYWEDIENCTDGYVDSLGSGSAAAPVASGIGSKRKRSCTEEQGRKKLRAERAGPGAQAICNVPPVTWRSSKEKRRDINTDRQVSEKDLGAPIAIFKDWRERFGDASGFVATTNGHADDIISEVSDATSDDDGSPSEHQHKAIHSHLHVDALKSAIAANLASSDGLPAGLDESTLLEYAMQMMANNGSAEDLLGQLTDEILEDADESNVEDIQEWVLKRKGETKPKSICSPDEAGNLQTDRHIRVPRQLKSSGSPVKPTDTTSAKRMSDCNRARKRKTTDTDCGASLKPQAKRREMSHVRKDAKVL